MNPVRTLFAALGVALALPVPLQLVAQDQAPGGTVSYFDQIRPIFEDNCQGCHQPSKDKGDFVITEYDRLMTPGDSEKPPIVPGKPDQSYLVQQITPIDGEAEMPQKDDPLPKEQIDLIRLWISQGAVNDTPAQTGPRYDSDHPPVYTHPPVIAAVDFSPDGTVIAVSGFHEVLLHKADGSGLAGRLIGDSERIQSVQFSPDGQRLAVAGGHPGRKGEIQVWDVARRELIVSREVGYDTLYGVSWSPDGKWVAFGCPDNTVRAIEADTGKQVLQQGSHNDWVLDTAFSTDGAHLVSVGRDMSAKLTEVATQRFIDNITSITPGALRGGIHSLARHPSKDEILVGGADGAPQVFQMFRQAARKIGDNATLLRRFPPMEGRIFGVDYSPDGTMICAGASLNGHGSIHIYASEFDSTIPDEILEAYKKTASQYTAEERTAIEDFVTSEIKQLHSIPVDNAPIYSVAFNNDGTRIAAAGGDGLIRLIDVESGEIVKAFEAATLTEEDPSKEGTRIVVQTALESPGLEESLPEDAEIVGLEVNPAEVRLSSRNEHVQLIVTANLASGESYDVTRLASFQLSPELGTISDRGRLTAMQNGSDTLTITFRDESAEVPVNFKGMKSGFQADFIQDVSPLLAKLGCNAGTCHGSKDGKNGFKLSLRGYDPVFDVRALADDHAARRVNRASPDDSLMLLKAVGEVPHEGKKRTTRDSEYYAILRQWIVDGSTIDTDSAAVQSIELFPKNPVIQQTNGAQQMRVVATYSDGARRDVTAETFIESGNTDILSTDDHGLAMAQRRGEAPILARYEGAYAATRVTVMGDRTGFVWQQPTLNNRIDELVAAKWKRMKILPSELCSDAEFIRRISLDLTGLPPTPEEVRTFLQDPAPTGSKREALIERKLADPAYVDYWANKWADLLQVNRKYLGLEGSRLFQDWIRKQVADNTPYDEFVRKLITASGSNRENPAASYYKILREPADIMENTTHLFLGTRFNCNKCHDHPFERWTQDQYYETAAFFARVKLKKDEQSGDRRIGGTAVEGAKPLFEYVSDSDSGEVKHDRTGEITPPEFPYPVAYEAQEKPLTRREKLAAWLTSPNNPYFAKSYVNRLWGYLMGVGLIEPLDDIRAGNPPSNPQLLDYLTTEFIESDFNTRHVLRLICRSRAYQLSVKSHEWNRDDKINYSHATARRLPAEVLLDAVYQVTGSTPNFPGAKPGTRAVQLLDPGIDLPSGFLANLGRPPRESACECERSNDIQLGSVMALLSGPAVSAAVNDPDNALAAITRSEPDDRDLVNQVFLRVLNRPARDREIDATLQTMEDLEEEHLQLIDELAKAEAAWAVRKTELEIERAETISKAENKLSNYLAERAPALAKQQRHRLERVADAKTAIADYIPALDQNRLKWERSLTDEHFKTAWVPLDVQDIRASGSVRLELLPDGSIRSEGSQGELPDYIVSGKVPLDRVTGIKLEVLTDAELPAFGPGFKDGNFLLSEFVVESAAQPEADDEPKYAPAKIAAANADYIESGYELDAVFDGAAEQGRDEGWKIGGAGGRSHWATFKLEQPIETAQEKTLKLTLQHRYQVPYEIGRFRIWVTGSPQALHEGLPADIRPVVQTPLPSRSEDQRAKLESYYRSIDPELTRRQFELQLARKPLPDDPKEKALQRALAQASEPVPTDPELLRLRQDVKMSTRQLANRRLTAVQDLAWALINTPAFLFNH